MFHTSYAAHTANGLEGDNRQYGEVVMVIAKREIKSAGRIAAMKGDTLIGQYVEHDGFIDARGTMGRVRGFGFHSSYVGYGVSVPATWVK